MAGETIRTEAVCLDIRPWSRTSHVVAWLTKTGVVSTVVKGAVRSKSAFLGQYDLNYTCDVVYYARAKGELHALRECSPISIRENLRCRYRVLLLAEYMRKLVLELAPGGADCVPWFDALVHELDCLNGVTDDSSLVAEMVVFELKVLDLAGLLPDFSGYDPNAEWSLFSVESARYDANGNRILRVHRDVAEWLGSPSVKVKNVKIPLDAARVIGVFYTFHVGCASEARRFVLGMISRNP